MQVFRLNRPPSVHPFIKKWHVDLYGVGQGRSPLAGPCLKPARPTWMTSLVTVSTTTDWPVCGCTYRIAALPVALLIAGIRCPDLMASAICCSVQPRGPICLAILSVITARPLSGRRTPRSAVGEPPRPRGGRSRMPAFHRTGPRWRLHASPRFRSADESIDGYGAQVTEACRSALARSLALPSVTHTDST